MTDPKSKDDPSIPGPAKKVDSLNMWPYIIGEEVASPRNFVHLGYNPKSKSGGMIRGKWKLVVGYQLDGTIPLPTTPDETDNVTDLTFPVEKRKPYNSPISCGKTGCLFDLEKDERELNDLKFSMRKEDREALLDMSKFYHEHSQKHYYQAHNLGWGDDRADARN